jgi:hypothetical protein
MSKKLWLLILPMLVLGLAACQQATATPETAEAPADPVVVPTESEVKVAEPVSDEEILTESVIDPEYQDLWQLDYVMPDGTTESPIENDLTDNLNLALLQNLVAVGDLNGDGNPDRAVILVDIADPANPNMYVAVVLDEQGTPVHAGTVALDENQDANAIRIENGELKVDVYVPNADGSGYELQTLTYALQDGKPVQSQPPQPQPAPTPVPTEAAKPSPAKVTVTIKPDVGIAGEKFDVYTHAFDNPHITGLDLHIDGQKVSEWQSPDPEGVPYIHHTFTIRKAEKGKFEIKVIARDKFGSEGISDTEYYTVK